MLELGTLGAGWRFAFASDLWLAPELLEPGADTTSTWLHDTMRARLRLDVVMDRSGLRDDTIAGAVALAGLAWRDIDVDGTGGGVLVILDSSFSHVEHVASPDSASFDRHARVSLAGVSAEVFALDGDTRLTARASLSPDFATIAPSALVGRPHLLDDVAPTKSVMEKERYYYAVGGSAELAASATWHTWSAAAVLAARAYESIDGLDRHQAELVDELHGSERRLECALSTTWRPASMPMALRLGYERRWQGGTLGDVSGARAVDLVSVVALLPL